jgi:GDPmannose 4,6-dehydratase
MKKAIIVGSQGQDGRLLFDLLTERGYSILGIGRDGVRGGTKSIDSQVDILDWKSVSNTMRTFGPDEVYYLAAVHHSSQDKPDEVEETLRRASYQVNFFGLHLFLHAIHDYTPRARLFYAASSHVFGNPSVSPQNENTPMEPTCHYGKMKHTSMKLCQLRRKTWGTFAACGILFNHESIHRRPEFVTRKIIDSAIRISRGQQDRPVLGDLSAKVDWGYAPDFVAAMHKILQLPEADDFVIATGIPHSVQEFVEIAFAAANLDWRKHVVEEKSLVGKSRTGLVGDSSHLRQSTGWSPSLDFNTMVRRLVEDISRIPDANNRE